jgi:hypothetical protein
MRKRKSIYFYYWTSVAVLTAHSAARSSIVSKLKSLYLTTTFLRPGGLGGSREIDYDAPLDTDGELFVRQNNIAK